MTIGMNLETLFWGVGVFVVIAIVAVVVLLAVRKGFGGKCAAYIRQLNDTDVFIDAVGGQWVFDKLSFIFPETLTELIREYGEIHKKRQREHEELTCIERELHLEWLEKTRQIPEPDGTPETELLRRDAQKIANRAYEAVQNVRRQWEYWSRNRTRVDALVSRAREKERARVVKEGKCVWLERETTAEKEKVHRRIFRLPDGRYFRVGFRLPMNDICFCNDSQEQYSEDELKAVIADKATRRAQAVAQA